MAGMVGVEAIGIDFFRVALNAMKDARLIRLIRVLEDDSQTASFWYLLKCNSPQVRRAARKAGLDLGELSAVATALKGIRDETATLLPGGRVSNRKEKRASRNQAVQP